MRRNAAGALPLDDALVQSLESYEVGFNLVPLPKSSSSDAVKSQPVSDHQQHWQYGGQWQQKGQWDRWQPYHKGKGHHKGKGKGKSKDKGQMLPKAFKGRDCTSVDPHGRRLCFSYNLGNCPHAADGAQCRSGWHLCMRTNCHAPHREKDHDASVKPPSK